MATRKDGGSGTRSPQDEGGKEGTPGAVRHLRPGSFDSSDEEFKQFARGGLVTMPEPTPEQEEQMAMARIIEFLQLLRDPFPPERIEKLPKPLWKGAWDGERKGQCPVCGGYHVIENTIHLDYVGHANCTDRLLEVDPLWSWEPLAYTPEGLPLFDRQNGLWIKLTVCGVTRLGYGDGNSVKEVIGDAIRNAAMRFGVALDLWAKINLHEERNPGDGPTPGRGRRDERTEAGVSDRERARGEVSRAAPAQTPIVAAQDALAKACDEHGLDPRTMRARYWDWAEKRGKLKLDIAEASADDLQVFTADLIAEVTAEGVHGGGSGAGARAADDGTEAGAGGDDATAEVHNGDAPDEPDTSGTEELF